MAPHFVTLSKLLAAHNALPNTPSSHAVALAQVDATEKKNEYLINEHAAVGFPTLKLYASGRLISEFDGSRDSQSMLQYIKDALLFRSSRIVEYLRTRQDLDAFLNRSADRPVVLSIFHPHYDPASVYPLHIRPCPESWHAATRRMRKISAPSVSFGAVAHHALLLPPDEQDMPRFRRVARVPFAPAIVGAPSGKRFWQAAEWWFPGVRETDSMETFMHVSTVEYSTYVVLDRFIAPVMLDTTRPLALAFVSGEGPSWTDRGFLIFSAKLRVQPRFASLYVNVSRYPEFAHYVSAVRGDEKNSSMLKRQYVVYRGGVSRPMIETFKEGSNQTVFQWLNERGKQINKSNFAIPPGVVFDLDKDSWQHIFEYDGRGVLLELYRSSCGACKRFASAYQKVARMLMPHSGALVVARLDVEKHSIPSTPKVPPLKFVPTVVYIPPGGDGILYEGARTARAVSQFARIQSETEDIPFERLSLVEIAAEYLLYIGLVMILLGVLTGRSTRNKNEHIT